MIPYFVLNQITFGPIKLYVWGLFVGLGFSAGYLLFYYLAGKRGLAPKKIAPLCGSIFFGAILGAKILALILISGGAMFMGGLVGAIIFGWLGVKLTKSNFWQMADLLVLPAALGIGIGRIGCVLVNDHQGAVTNLPWGIMWPDGSARHPLAIYESLAGFGLLAVFWFLRKYLFQNSNKKISPNPPLFKAAEGQGPLFTKGGVPSFLKGGLGGIFEKSGQLFLLFIAAYSAIRFFLDFTRVTSGPLADPRWGILSASQWIALGLFFIFLALFNYRRKC